MLAKSVNLLEKNPQIKWIYHHLVNILGMAPDDASYHEILLVMYEFIVHHNSEGLRRLWKEEFIDGEPPVPPDKFLTDPYYLGEFRNSLYDVWKKDLLYVLNPFNRIEEWALVGAQGTGKTTAALTGQSYKVYWISRLKHPQRYFLMDPTADIFFGFFTLNKDKADDILYKKFQGILEQSNYFKDRFPMRRRRIGGLRVSKSIQDQTAESDWAYELLFPKNLHVVSGSQTAHALSIDLMSVVLDEMNWRRKKTLKPEDDVNSAVTLYEQVRTRITSRFMSQGVKPGLLTIISSKRSTTDFMDTLVARMKKEPHRCYVSDYALWEAKPDRIYSGKKFYVSIGGSYGRTHIVDNEKLHEYDLTQPNIIAVPVEYRPEFEMNVNTAVRDIAGVSTVSHELLFERDNIITQCIDQNRTSPFITDIIVLGTKTPYPLNHWFKHKEFTHHDGFKIMPKFWPHSERYIHIDLSKTTDATGMTMLCPYQARRMVAHTPEGKPYLTIVPLVWVDFMIRLIPPPEDQIDYDKIRQFIMYLRNVGFKIVNVSFDQYQSADSIQMLAKAGFATNNISVEADLPYVNLRTAMMQKRINMYPYEPVVYELKSLIHNIETESVDHPEQDPLGGPGRKDVADSLCGAYTALARAIVATKPTVASPTTVQLGHIRPTEPGQPSERVKQIFEGLVPEVPKSVTGWETDRFATADYTEHPKRSTVEEVLKQRETEEKAEEAAAARRNEK